MKFEQVPEKPEQAPDRVRRSWNKSVVYETELKPIPEGMPEDWPKEAGVEVRFARRGDPGRFIIEPGMEFAGVSVLPDKQFASTMEEAVEIAKTMLDNMDKWSTQEYPYSE